jgi:hypothetical protein
MKFRNPWIDPRVEQVRTANLLAYLDLRGWRRRSDPTDSFQSFEKPTADNFGPVVNVPRQEQARDFVQRVIEAVSDLALAEDRYAVDVLNDILSTAPPHSASPGNGADKGTTVASSRP